MARDKYTKQTWENLPSENTPITAERLIHIEDGIKTAMDNRALKEVYGDESLQMGSSSKAEGRYSVAVGTLNKATAFDSHAEGQQTTASGNESHAEGIGTTASGEGAHAEGAQTKATAMYSHSEGNGTTASGQFSHAEGQQTVANGVSCHTEGYKTEANIAYSHAEGQTTKANKPASHAEGLGTVADSGGQHVQGKYNVADANNLYAHIVGGGTSDTDRKNIHTLDWAGNAYYAGDVTNGMGVSLNSLKSDIDNVSAIAAGGSNAKIFDTKAELDAWLAVEGNTETLSVGQNIYIKATETPDYWWDGTGLQVLETEKVVVESLTYDETMAILNAAEEVD